LGHPRVLDRTDASSGSFLYPRVEPAQNRVQVWVLFFTRGVPETPKKTQNMKKPQKSETRKNSKQKKPKRKKNLKETRKNLERIKFTKADGFRLRCQISPVGAGSGIKINLTTFFHESGFQYIRPKSDPLPSLYIYIYMTSYKYDHHIYI
jgi:hypothetical protein